MNSGASWVDRDQIRRELRIAARNRAQHQCAAQRVPEHEPDATMARNDYLTAQVPNPFVGLMPASAPAGFRGATISGSSCSGRIRTSATSTRRPMRDSPGTTRCSSAWSGGCLRGYTFNVAYTWSRFEEAINFLNAGRSEPTRMISDMDAPHRLAVSGIWELPFGQGRRSPRTRTPWSTRSSEVGRYQAFTSTRRARRSAISATRSWSDRSTISRSQAANARWNAGSTWTRSTGTRAAARVQRPHVPDAVR